MREILNFILIFVFSVFLIIQIISIASYGAEPKYFPVNRKVSAIQDFIFPYAIKGRSEITINVSAVDIHNDEYAYWYDIPRGMTSQIYFEDAITNEIWYEANISGSGGGGGVIHTIIKNPEHKCIIGLNGPGEFRLMYFPSAQVSKNISNLFMMKNVENPAYFEFKTPPNVCVYAFNEELIMTSFNESSSTTKRVTVSEEDVDNLNFEFFVFYNRSGGDVGNVKLVAFNHYEPHRELPPEWGAAILIIIVTIAIISYLWVREK